MTSQLRSIVKMAIAVTLSLPASAQYSYWSDAQAVGSTGFSMAVSELWTVYLDEVVVDSTLSSSTGYRTGSDWSMSHAEVDLFLNAGGSGCDTFSVHSFHYIISEGWMYNPGNTSDSANVCGSGGGGGGGSLGAIGDYERFDGENGPVFTVPIGSGTPTAYSWSWAVPNWVSSPQNSPNVAFSSPQTQSTSANTHWYSNDGSQCGSLKKAPYDISAAVNFTDGQQLTGSGTYKVSIDGFRGLTRADDVAIVGLPTVIYVPAYPAGYYLVMSPAGLSRTLPVPTYDYVTTGSQFWPKISEHEQAHVSHFTSGPFQDYQTVDGLWARIGYYSNPSLGGVYSYVDTQKSLYYIIQRYTAQDGPLMADRVRWSEQAAYAYSDNYAPHYHFEGACHPQ